MMALMEMDVLRTTLRMTPKEVRVLDATYVGVWHEELVMKIAKISQFYNIQ